MEESKVHPSLHPPPPRDRQGVTRPAPPVFPRAVDKDFPAQSKEEKEQFACWSKFIGLTFNRSKIAKDQEKESRGHSFSRALYKNEIRR